MSDAELPESKAAQETQHSSSNLARTMKASAQRLPSRRHFRCAPSLEIGHRYWPLETPAKRGIPSILDLRISAGRLFISPENRAASFTPASDVLARFPQRTEKDSATQRNEFLSAGINPVGAGGQPHEPNLAEHYETPVRAEPLVLHTDRQVWHCGRAGHQSPPTSAPARRRHFPPAIGQSGGRSLYGDSQRD